MKARVFKSPLMQKTYDKWVKRNPHDDDLSFLIGFGRVANAYVVGRRQSDTKSPYHNVSTEYAAWAAGVDNARRA